MKKFKSTGFVLGNYWGGGKGYYPAEKLEAKTRKALENKINKGIQEGWLDSGMGFDGLLGAIIEIETIETITKDKKSFNRSEFEICNFCLTADDFDNGRELFLNN